jgi:hypothetical protein
MSARIACLLTALLLTCAPTLTARGDDELDRIVQRDRILADKLRTEVTTALARAKALERVQPQQARLALQNALTKVQNAQELPADEQKRLVATLQSRLRVLGETSREPNLAQDVRRRPRDPGPAGSSVPLAEDFIGGTNKRLAGIEKRKLEAERGLGGTLDGLRAAAVPADGDFTLPRDWAERTARRRKLVGPQMTPKEVALVKALNSVLSINFKGTSLKDALNYLQDRTGQSIIVDVGSLRELNVDYEDPVNFQVQKVTFRTALKKILADRGLSYIIKEGAIQVMSAAKARDQMVIRTYPVDDFVNTTQVAMWFGPFVARAQMFANAQNLINTIQASIDPGLWNVNGGPGSIVFDPSSMSLVVRAPAEFHFQMAGGGGLLGAR